jgi:hypothetical protein
VSRAEGVAIRALGYLLVRKTGRCHSGSQRDAGSVLHQLDTSDGGLRDCDMRPALCGTKPGRTSGGWAAADHIVPRCDKCRRISERLRLDEAR